MTAQGGALDASVTLDEVFAVVGAKRVPLAPELAGYLVLEIAEHADPSGGDVDPKSVFIGEEGSVALVKRRDGAGGDAEASTRAVLARLLEASGAQTPALAATSKRKSGAGMHGLAEELEAALIPVNRAAGRRALARLAREVKRVTLGVGRHVSSPSHAPASDRAPSAGFSREEDPTTARGKTVDEAADRPAPAPEPRDPPAASVEAPAPTPAPLPTPTPTPAHADVDQLIANFGVSGSSDQSHSRELKAIVGLPPTPPPPEIARRMETREVPIEDVAAGAGETDVEALLAQSEVAEPAARAPRAQRPHAAPPLVETTEAAPSERELPTGPSELRRSRKSLASTPKAKGRRGSGLVVVLAIVALATGAYLLWQLRPSLFGRAPDRAPSPAPATQPAQSAPACKATLVVGDVAAHAEVLLRAGQAPVDVERMPVGTRLEFVATAEGYAPKRAVVPAGAGWDTGADGKPFFEIAVQLEKTRARPGANDPWPAGEPGSEVGGQGPPGTVHVVSTPRGAEVWMLAGIGPEARIEQARCDQDVDVLIAGPTTFRKRLHVAAADFAAEEGPGAPKGATRVARVSAK